MVMKSSILFLSEDKKFMVVKSGAEYEHPSMRAIMFCDMVVQPNPQSNTFRIIKDRWHHAPTSKKFIEQHLGVNTYMSDYETKDWKFRDSQDRMYVKLKYGF